MVLSLLCIVKQHQSKSLFKNYLFLLIYTSIWVASIYVHSVFACYLRSLDDMSYLLELKIKPVGNCQAISGNQTGPSQMQPVCLTTESSLQSPIRSISHDYSYIHSFMNTILVQKLLCILSVCNVTTWYIVGVL